jgi:hypothetical protein
MSKTCRKYLSSLGIAKIGRDGVKELKTKQPVFRIICEPFFLKLTGKYPICLGVHFIRSTKHHFDFNNATQIIADLFVSYGFVPDDDCDHLYIYPIPHDYIHAKNLPDLIPLCHQSLAYSYDKLTPGIYIKYLG